MSQDWSGDQGFNRNIVECKVTGTIQRGAGRQCFNRNIVECKGKRQRIPHLVFSVLIETLWNVKRVCASTSKGP